MEITQILAFALVALLLVISPGPNGLLILKTVPSSGRLAGFANVAGFIGAFYVHGALSILGISLILVQSAEIFFFVKLLGAAYLCWIGVNALRSALVRGVAVGGQPKVQGDRVSLEQAFVEGFLTNLLNPKVSMFYLAAFPQFIPLQGSMSDAFVLVLVHSVLNFLWFSSVVILLARLSFLARQGRLQKLVKLLTGFVFVGFGFKLASMPHG